MQTELEAKFLDLDVEKVRTLLKQNGAVLVHPERLMRRKNFDYPDARLKKIGGWIRIRDEGDKVTLAYKQLDDRTLHGTKEISLVVEDFEKISNWLQTVGFIMKSYQETKRERWEINGVEVTIDTWPWIPAFAEIEGDDENEIKAVANKLDLNWPDAIHGSVENAYQKYYDVTDDEIDEFENLTFTPVPDWLLAKKKTATM